MHKPLSIGRPVKLIFGIVLLVCAILGAVANERAIGHGPGRPDPADFDVFHLAGRLVWTGQLAQVYRMSTLAPLETAATGSRDFIPFSYPPLFAEMLAPLAVLPVWLAQLLFTVASLALYLVVTYRLAGPLAWPVWLAEAPSLCLNLEAGQNGLLTAGLVGAAAASLLADRPRRAGAAIAALAIKPHLALMLPIVLLTQRRWTILAIAGAGALGLTGLSIATLGCEVFSAFLHTFGEVSRFMAAGAYPLPRMISLYAALLSWGVPAGPALAMHGVAAAAVLCIATQILWTQEDQRSALGLALLATVFLSPYLYDYDGTVFGVGLALLAPGLASRLPARRLGLILTVVAASLAVGIVSIRIGIALSSGGPMLLVVFCVLARIVGREPLRFADRHRAATQASEVAAL